MASARFIRGILAGYTRAHTDFTLYYHVVFHVVAGLQTATIGKGVSDPTYKEKQGSRHYPRLGKARPFYTRVRDKGFSFVQQEKLSSGLLSATCRDAKFCVSEWRMS